MAEKKILLTKEGLKKLTDKLEYLKSVRRIEVSERLKAAIALGDLSENSEYEDAKNEQAFLEGEIINLESQINNCDLIETKGASDTVHMGHKILLRDLEYKEDFSYTIVGSAEADPLEGKISNESPVGAAVIGKKVGSTVEVHAPAGVIRYKIVKIEP